MKNFPLLLFALLLLSACGKFSKAMKSTDEAYKKQVMQEYFDAGKWDRAIPMLEELIVITRGDSESERMNYLHAKAHFEMKDYIMGGYYLNNFTRTFPRSQYAEECAFLAAYCHYKNSPNFELDQSETRSAIDQLQLFMVRYPGSNLRDSCNTLIDQLRYKLEVKAFQGGEQYYRMRNYQAAGVCYRTFARDWPNSRFREDAMLRIVQSDHFLAMNSVPSKKKERLEDGIRSYTNFADAFPNSPKLVEAERLHKEMKNALEEFQTTP